jgi:tRNA (mo5U34)-methyltransferase
VIVKKLKIGSSGLTLTIGDGTVETVRSNIFYRMLIRPVRRFLSLLRNTPDREEGKRAQADEVSGKDRQVKAADATPEQTAILTRISGIEWYHSIDLGHGVVTPGMYDHRPVLSQYRLPDLKGKRVLDVATFDGYWAFEFEKMGAREVVAMDVATWNEIDIPPRIRVGASKEDLATKTGTGFNLAREILRSKVERGIMNVYNLSPEWKGKFDFVFCGDLLLHLMNPMKALQNIHSVVSGYAYIVDVFNPEFGDDEENAVLRYAGGTGRMVWWRFGLGSLKKMIKDAGFREVEMVCKFEVSVKGQTEKYWRAVYKAYP